MPGSSESTNIDPVINIDFEENSPFQEGIISASLFGETPRCYQNLPHNQ